MIVECHHDVILFNFRDGGEERYGFMPTSGYPRFGSAKRILFRLIAPRLLSRLIFRKAGTLHHFEKPVIL
jgi:hypothetical protein